jgi:hypothetical protein
VKQFDCLKGIISQRKDLSWIGRHEFHSMGIDATVKMKLLIENVYPHQKEERRKWQLENWNN